jgi:hypothetical protein
MTVEGSNSGATGARGHVCWPVTGSESLMTLDGLVGSFGQDVVDDVEEFVVV